MGAGIETNQEPLQSLKEVEYLLVVDWIILKEKINLLRYDSEIQNNLAIFWYVLLDIVQERVKPVATLLTFTTLKSLPKALGCEKPVYSFAVGFEVSPPAITACGNDLVQNIALSVRIQLAQIIFDHATFLVLRNDHDGKIEDTGH